MKLNNRWLLTHILNAIIPLLVTIIAGFIYVMISANFWHNNIGLKDFENYVELENKAIQFQKEITKSSSLLAENNYGNYLINRAKQLDMDIVILNGDIELLSSIKLSIIDKNKLSHYFLAEDYAQNISLEKGNYFIVGKKINNHKNQTLQLYLLNKNSIDRFNFQKFYIIMLIVYMTAFIITCYIFSKIFTKSIIQPLSNLSKAVKNIAKGELDKEIVQEGDTEIISLAKDFELMRIELKESINNRLKLDENRKILVSSISHDLRTPITSIKGYIEAILDGTVKDMEKIMKYLRNAYNRAETIENMMEDLFLYSKLDVKQVAFDLQKCQISEFFACFVEEQKAILNKKEVHIDFVNSLEKKYFVLVDYENFKRVITNIVDNACNYMEKEHKKITIYLRKTDTDIIIEIQDNGIGINKSELQRIFNRFYRSDASRNNVSGTGLGLAIAKEIIEGFGGSIWARSSKNEWTSILISLEIYGG